MNMMNKNNLIYYYNLFKNLPFTYPVFKNTKAFCPFNMYRQIVPDAKSSRCHYLYHNVGEG